MNIETRTEGLMSEVQDLAKRVEAVKVDCTGNNAQPNPIVWEGSTRGDVLSNLTLAIRHLEDAQSRIERAWQRMGTNETN